MARADMQVDIFNSQSIRHARTLGEIMPGQENHITSIADDVEIPQASLHHSGNRDCQDWIFELVRKLEDADIINQGSADYVERKFGTSWTSYVVPL